MSELRARFDAAVAASKALPERPDKAPVRSAWRYLLAVA
jgi:hypothetical protein